MKVEVFDIEANGFDATKIHCLSTTDATTKKSKSTTSYANITKFLEKADVLVGHNIVRYDIPTLERILGVKVRARLVDTLALSWYLFPKRPKHGLADWGEEFGVPKPKVDDWENLSPEEYIHRCEEDVKINTLLWEKIWKYLRKLYDTEEDAWRLIDYLTFKMDCARQQEQDRWRLDVPLCKDKLGELEALKEEKVDALRLVMPKVAKTSKKTRPKKPFKQDGTPSAVGEKWFYLLAQMNYPHDYQGTIEVVTGYEEPNPNSHNQIKKWLFDLGWVPTTFKFDRDKETGDVRKIPQVQQDKRLGPGLCESVKRLYDREPGLEILDGLSIISHRISILKGFLDIVDEEGYVQARVQGLTNTLRFKHSVVVNLPGVDKLYGDVVRGCLIAPEGYELCGSDMSSLEDRTKQHYMWDHDPEYVKEMMTPDFDPHLDLAVFAKEITEAQATRHKNKEEDFGPIRKVYKAVNYSCTYGAGGPTVARTAGVPEHKGYDLVNAYWERNWSLTAIADNCVTKTCNGQKWLYNPLSRMWYTLRHDKDRFSTLNQGTGVYCFDTWVKHVRSKRPQLTGQFHDEIILCVKKGNRDACTKLLKWAVNETNKELKLNRELDVDVQFGDSYAEIH